MSIQVATELLNKKNNPPVIYDIISYCGPHHLCDMVTLLNIVLILQVLGTH